MPIVSTFQWNGYRIDITDDARADRRVLLTYEGSSGITVNADSLWTSFSASYPQYAASGRFYQVETRGGADIITKSSGGGIFSKGGADVITSFATTGGSQVHIYAATGDDTINLSFANIGAGFSAGHHVYAEEANSPTSLGSDSFNFQSTGSVGAGEVVVGRLDDFDATRDTLRIDGAVVNLNALPSGVKIVMHNGDTTDPGAPPQQWLVIKTPSGGYIVYTLEGARQTAATGGEHGSEEVHFISQTAADAIIALYEAGPSAWYVNPDNYVPVGMTAQGGVVISDDDDMAHDVMDPITGGTAGDLIAAGLNNDTVNAGSGNDRVWGGSGHDVVNGDAGNDTLYGNLGNDVINGGDGDDLIYYQEGADSIYGGAGIDTLVISSATAPTISLQNLTNNQTIVVSGVENLTGSGRNDTLAGDGLANQLRGSDGNDSLTGWAGDDTLWGDNGNDFLGGLGQADDLYGGAGVDTLQAGAGIDELFGGTSADVFRFIAVSEAGDLIQDFSGLGGELDKIWVKVSGFNTAPSTGLVAGALTAARFWSSTSNTANDLDDRFIFRTTDKTLWFDADGTLAGGVAPVLLADLQNTAANMTYQDIVLY